ncbi:MAG: tetratricopeptide repeat protein [bacterium]
MSCYWGIVLPYSKLRITLRNKYILTSVQSPEALYKLVGDTFHSYSPIDDREAIFDYLIQLCKIMKSQQDQKTTEFLIAVADENIAPLLGTKREKRFGHNLFQMGMLYKLAYNNTEDGTYFRKSVDYFNAALEYNPNHPGALYNLSYIYYEHGDTENEAKIAARVIKLWPNDQKFRSFSKDEPQKSE